MAKKKATKAEREYMGRVAEIPCCVCGFTEVELHHVRNNTGLGVRPSHYDTISLCYNHHRGAEGVHTIGKKTWAKKFGSELDILIKVKEMLDGE